MTPLVKAFVSRCKERGLDDSQIKESAVSMTSSYPELKDEFEDAFGKDAFLGETLDKYEDLQRTNPGVAIGTQLLAPLNPVTHAAVSAPNIVNNVRKGNLFSAAGEAASVGLSIIPGLGPIAKQVLAPSASIIGQSMQAGHNQHKAENQPQFSDPPEPKFASYKRAGQIGDQIHHRVEANSGILPSTGIGAGIGAGAGYLMDQPLSGAGAGAGFQLGRAGGDIAGTAIGSLLGALAARVGRVDPITAKRFIERGGNWGHRAGGVAGAMLGTAGGYTAARSLSGEDDEKPRFKFAGFKDTMSNIGSGIAGDVRGIGTATGKGIGQVSDYIRPNSHSQFMPYARENVSDVLSRMSGLAQKYPGWSGGIGSGLAIGGGLLAANALRKRLFGHRDDDETKQAAVDTPNLPAVIEPQVIHPKRVSRTESSGSAGYKPRTIDAEILHKTRPPTRPSADSSTAPNNPSASPNAGSSTWSRWAKPLGYGALGSAALLGGIGMMSNSNLDWKKEHTDSLGRDFLEKQRELELQRQKAILDQMNYPSLHQPVV